MAREKNKRAVEDILLMEQEPWVEQEVKFRPIDKVIDFFQNEPIVISTRLNKYEVRRDLVDTCSSFNLLTLDVFNKLGLDKNDLVKVSYPLVGLGDKIVLVLGVRKLRDYCNLKYAAKKNFISLIGSECFVYFKRKDKRLTC